MLYILKFKNILPLSQLLALSAFVASSIAMESLEQNAQNKSALTPEILEAIRKGQETANKLNVQNILQKVQSDTETAKARQEKQLADAINNQNTLIASVSVNPNKVVNPILDLADEKIGDSFEKEFHSKFPKNLSLPNLSLGIYKRDFIELIGFLTEIAADKLYFDKVQEERLNFIFNSIKTNKKDLIEVLEKVSKDKEAFLKEYDQKLAITKIFVNKDLELDKINKPLKDHIDNKQVYVTYKTLIKTELLLPMALNHVAKKGAYALESKLIYNTWKPRILEAGYKKNADGTLEQTFTPSIISILKVLWSPSKIGYVFIGHKKMFNFELINKYINEINGKFFWKLPMGDFMNHEYFHYFTEFVSKLLTVKIFDQLYNMVWQSYLLKHQDELYKILTKYNNATEEDIKKIDKELTEFIKTGNSIKKWFSKLEMPNSKFSKLIAEDRVNLYQRLPFIITYYWGVYKFYKYQLFGSI